jgi:phage-related tail fiber protein
MVCGTGLYGFQWYIRHTYRDDAEHRRIAEGKAQLELETTQATSDDRIAAVKAELAVRTARAQADLAVVSDDEIVTTRKAAELEVIAAVRDAHIRRANDTAASEVEARLAGQTSLDLAALAPAYQQYCKSTAAMNAIPRPWKEWIG